MSDSNDEKGHLHKCRILKFPSVNIPNDEESCELGCVDVLEQGRRNLAESYRHALELYFQYVPNADSRNVIKDKDTGEIKIRIRDDETIDVIKLMRKEFQEKPVLKAIS